MSWKNGKWDPSAPFQPSETDELARELFQVFGSIEEHITEDVESTVRRVVDERLRELGFAVPEPAVVEEHDEWKWNK